MRTPSERLRRAAGLGLLLGLAALGRGTVLADVDPAPAWRLGDAIATTAIHGERIYVGGPFSQLYTPSTTEEQFYDLVTAQVRADCARSTNASRPLGGVPDGVGGLLVPVQDGDTFADVNGPFAPPAGTTLVRVAETCLWDRPFVAPVIDPAAPDDATIGRPARVGDTVVLTNAVYVPELLQLRAQAASFDARNGARLAFRYYDGVTDIHVLGATASRVVVSLRSGFLGTYVLGAINPSTLELTQSASVLADENLAVRSWVRGDTLYRLRPAPSNALEAYDLTTLAPRLGWSAPIVPALLDLETVGGRVFLTARIVNGQTLAPPAALLAASGAIDTAWLPPALTRRVPDPGGVPYVPTLTALATDGQRLFMSGDFERVGGVDREGVAALQASGGGLDLWDPAPAVVSPIEATTTALLMSRPSGTNRITRRYLAAVDRATGALTPWNPNDPARVLLHAPTPVAALAADAQFVYFASATTGEILRAGADSADVDQTWRVVVTRADGSPGVVTSMVLANGLLYLGGTFDYITGATFAQATRRSLAAVAPNGALSDWAPQLEGPAGATLVRAILPLGPTIYLGGEFIGVNDEFRPGFAAVDALTGLLAMAETYVQGETRIHGLATDGVRVLLGGVSIGAPFVGAVTPPDASVTPFGPSQGVVPSSLAFTAGRLYAGLEYDTELGTPTARATRWGRVWADERALLHLTDDGTLESFPALPGNPPGAPTLSAISSGNTVTVSWTPNSAGGTPSSYTLYAGSAPGAFNLAAIPLRGTTTFTATVPTGLYYLAVAARNGYGASPLSNEVAVQAGCVAAPPAPSAPSFTTSGGAVVIAWPPSATATSYVLEAGQAPGTMNLGAVPLGNVTRFTATAPLGTYYVRVRASNACGTSAPSSESVVVLDGSTPPPATPTGFTAAVTGRSVGFAWSPALSGGTPSGYQIEAGVTPGGVIAVLPTAATSFVVPQAPAGTFYVRVRAVNAAGASAPTADVTVVVP